MISLVHSVLPFNYCAFIANVEHVFDDATLRLLNRAGLLTPENHAALLANTEYFAELTSAFWDLHHANLLILENVTALLLSNARHARVLVNAFRDLNDVDLLTPENRKALVANAKYATELAFAIECLNARGLLTPENLAELVLGNGVHIEAIAQFIDNISTQAEFDALVQGIKTKEKTIVIEAAIALSSSPSRTMPTDLIGHIVSLLAPSYQGGPNYQNMAQNRAERVERIFSMRGNM